MTDEYREPELGPVVELARPALEDSALDYDCGVGQTAFVLAPLVGSMTAAGDDPELLGEGRRLQAELGFADLTLDAVDLLSLPYPDGSYDLVVSRGALHRSVDPVATLREMARMTAPRGRIVVCEVLVDETSDRYLNELSRLREPDHWRHYRSEEYEDFFRESGLTCVEQRVVRSSVDLDYWIEAAQTPVRNGELIRARMRALPVPVQAAMDVAFADRHIAFSFELLAARLEL